MQRKIIYCSVIIFVFVGNVDIVNGNLKLILGLIWSLIVRYQIGRSKFPPRKLMLAWLQAVLPECKVSNLTTDWNSGILLSALVDYCQPGLFPHWKSLSKFYISFIVISLLLTVVWVVWFIIPQLRKINLLVLMKNVFFDLCHWNK